MKKATDLLLHMSYDRGQGERNKTYDRGQGERNKKKTNRDAWVQGQQKKKNKTKKHKSPNHANDHSYSSRHKVNPYVTHERAERGGMKK
jgi:hypothetical protein